MRQRTSLKLLSMNHFIPKAAYFGTYDEAKARMKLEIKLPWVVNKGKRRIGKLKSCSTLLLTKGKDEDEQGEEVEDEE